MKLEAQIEKHLTDCMNEIDNGMGSTKEEIISRYANKIAQSIRVTDVATIHRSAESGRFVSKSAAEASPATTIMSKLKKYFLKD